MNASESYSLYCHTNKTNGKQYIGITKRKPEKRWGFNGVRYSEQLLGAAIEKYGWNGFTHEVIMTGLTKKAAEEAERRLIKERKTLAPNGYNLTSGGNLGTEVSDVTREKLRASRIGKTASQETRNKISAIHKGKVVSEETKKKISNSRKGIKESKEWRERISNGLKGRTWTDSQRKKQKMRVYAKGADSKMSKKVAKFTKDGVFIETYGSVREAQLSIGNNHHISDCCMGKVGSAGGYVWKYVDE